MNLGYSFKAAALLAALTVSTGHAEELSPAAQATKEQIAAQLGVNPDAHTLAELNQLMCRLDGAESEAEKARLLAGLEGFAAVPTEPSAESKEQLAASLGVSPDEFTLMQLTFLKSMIEDDDCNVTDPEAYALAGEQITPATASAKAQLALMLGVEPTQYTLSELVEMKVDADM